MNAFLSWFFDLLLNIFVIGVYCSLFYVGITVNRVAMSGKKQTSRLPEGAKHMDAKKSLPGDVAEASEEPHREQALPKRTVPKHAVPKISAPKPEELAAEVPEVPEEAEVLEVTPAPAVSDRDLDEVLAQALAAIKTVHDDPEFRGGVNAEGNYELWRVSTNNEVVFVPKEVDGHPTTRICDYAFVDLDTPRVVVLPETVKEIGAFAFDHCSSLEQVCMSEGLESVGDRAFFECARLRSCAFPEGTTSLGAGVFTDCTALEEVTVPSTVTKIRGPLMVGCPNAVVVAPELSAAQYHATLYGLRFRSCS